MDAREVHNGEAQFAEGPADAVGLKLRVTEVCEQPLPIGIV